VATLIGLNFSVASIEAEKKFYRIGSRSRMTNLLDSVVGRDEDHLVLPGDGHRPDRLRSGGRKHVQKSGLVLAILWKVESALTTAGMTLKLLYNKNVD